VQKEVDGKPVLEVRELVKVNHHRNCLLCHAPANATPGANRVTGTIPTPGEPLPPSQVYYSNPPRDMVVRADVTYLRQDFSMMVRVLDAEPWPMRQRFDFLVRSRVVGEEEAAVFQEKLGKQTREELTPYEKSISIALAQMTGRTPTTLTASAWRKMLQIPAPTVRAGL
jgi:hypothetical protein